jgi:cytochrome c551/c552
VIARPALLLGAAALVTAAAAGTLRDDGEPAAAVDPTVTLDGASLFRAKGCAGCHTGPDTASFTDVGPSLANAAEWAGTRIDGLSAEDYIRQSIIDPQAFISPRHDPDLLQMPTLALAPEELDALVTYLLAGD